MPSPRTLCLVAALPILAIPATAQQRPMQLADLSALQGVGDPQLSPDGRTVAYVRSQTNHATDSVTTEIVVTALSGGGSTVTFSGAAPRWSPDGTSIAFMGRRDGRSGLFIRDVTSGAERFLVSPPQTDHWLGRSPKNWAWSPDGAMIAYVAADGPGHRQGDGPSVFSRVMYKTRTGFSDDRKTHVYVISSRGGAPRCLTCGAYDEHSIAWAPDSKRIAFVSDRSTDPDNTYANDIFVVDVVTGATTQITRTPSAEFSPHFSPDGRWISYEGWLRPHNTKDSPAEDQHLFVIDAHGGIPRQLARRLDRRITESTWAPGGRYLYFAAADRGANVIYRVSPTDDVVDTVVAGRFQARNFAFDGNGSRMVFLRTDDTHPAEIFVAASDGTGPRQVTHHNDDFLSRIAARGAEEFWFDSFDGSRVQGWVMKPVGAVPGRKYPAILDIHGGPHGAFGVAWADLHQIEAAAGYGVVFINPRGSVGYGQTFSDGSVLNWGGGDFRDLMAGLDAAIAANPWIDTTRLGVTGGSYGGFMTNWTITQTHRFKAAVSVASLSNLISFYGTSLYTDLVEAEFNMMPWDNYSLLWQWSPLAHVAGTTTPTLFLHGEADHDVPITQAEEMYTALRKLGVDATLARYPGEGHGFTRPRFIMDSDRRLLAWFDKYLGQADARSQSEAKP
ncbi:MAG TPA: S9 family peptidase [Gemmatimonadaceae bacterium]